MAFKVNDQPSAFGKDTFGKDTFGQAKEQGVTSACSSLAEGACPPPARGWPL